MQRNYLWAIGIVFCMATIVPDAGCEVQPAVEEETEILKITVGEPTLLDLPNFQNAASISGSRTGVVAAFYPKPLRHYRTSSDGGVTWGPETDSPPQLGGGSTSGTLRDGGVIKMLTMDDKTRSFKVLHIGAG